MKNLLIKIHLILCILIFDKSHAENIQDHNQDLILAISQNNLDNVKLALALGARANFEDPQNNNSILFNTLEKLRNSYLEAQKKWIYISSGSVMFILLLLASTVIKEPILHKHIYDKILKLVLAGTMSSTVILSAIKVYKAQKNYDTSLKIVRELLLTAGTFVDKKIEEEFTESEDIPLEIASMLKAIIVAQGATRIISAITY